MAAFFFVLHAAGWQLHRMRWTGEIEPCLIQVKGVTSRVLTVMYTNDSQRRLGNGKLQ